MGLADRLLVFIGVGSSRGFGSTLRRSRLGLVQIFVRRICFVCRLDTQSGLGQIEAQADLVLIAVAADVVEVFILLCVVIRLLILVIKMLFDFGLAPLGARTLDRDLRRRSVEANTVRGRRASPQES